MSDQVLGPTLSYFSNRMLYDTFDVTALLQQGDNAVGVWLAPDDGGFEPVRAVQRLHADGRDAVHVPHSDDCRVAG